MNFRNLFVSLVLLAWMDIICGSRPHKTKKKIETGRLSKYLSGEGRVSRQLVNGQTDDETLIHYRPGEHEMQGDTVPHRVDMEDFDVQREICCTLGKESARKLDNCSVKPYVRLVKQHLRQKLISEKLELEIMSQSSDVLMENYKCVLRHRHSFEKCCHAANIHHKNNDHNKRH